MCIIKKIIHIGTNLMNILQLLIKLFFITVLVLLINACSSSNSKKNSKQVHHLESTNGYDIRTLKLKHPSAYVSEMCYTKTVDKNNKTHNPCFACHTKNIVPNYIIDDDDLQEIYNFPESALKNPYLNHFVDFNESVAKITDDEIVKYINKSNYFYENGAIILKKELKNLSKYWDVNGDGIWSGYVPDCYYHFDKEGFDTEPNGKYSGWRAFGYMPFLGTFWPTNGSTDDSLIRLGSAFMRMDENGSFDKDVYKINLAIVESLIKKEDVSIDEVDEKKYGVDLDKNGFLSKAMKIVYKWAPNDGINMFYVGYANKLLKNKKLHLAAGLFPEGTEFLHSVRYIKSDVNGSISLAPHMKELRYAKKTLWLTYANLRNKGMATIKEKDTDPDKLEVFRGNMEVGLGNNMGWVYQGFIEDKYGDLRPQSYEEVLYCMGCHSGLGVTTDSIFSFPRKLNSYTSAQKGWFYWSQHTLKNISEYRYKDGIYELTNYLKLNKSGDEFRENSEIKHKFFLANGDFNKTAISHLHKDVTELLNPTHKRALLLNKGYRALVETQLFIDGRAGHIKPLHNVYKELKEGTKTDNKKYIIH